MARPELEQAEAESRESFCRFVLSRMEWVSQAYGLNPLEDGVMKAMVKGYQMALRDVGSPLAEYLEGWEV